MSPLSLERVGGRGEDSNSGSPLHLQRNSIAGCRYQGSAHLKGSGGTCPTRNTHNTRCACWLKEPAAKKIETACIGCVCVCVCVLCIGCVGVGVFRTAFLVAIISKSKQDTSLPLALPNPAKRLPQPRIELGANARIEGATVQQELNRIDHHGRHQCYHYTTEANVHPRRPICYLNACKLFRSCRIFKPPPA